MANDGKTPAVRLGVRLQLSAAASSEPAALRAFVATAVAAEAAGFDLVAVPERISGAGGAPAALPLCAAIAASTQRIRIATALVPLPLHHPLRLAEDAATLDGLSGGRFELGVGLGADVEELAGFGLDAAERTSLFEESVELLRLAWRGAPFAYEGKHFQFAPLEVFPRPLQAGGPPLWVGAAAASAQRRAARLAAGLVVPAALPCAAYLEECARAGTRGRVALISADAALALPRLAELASASVHADLWLDLSSDSDAATLAARWEEARASLAAA